MVLVLYLRENKLTKQPNKKVTGLAKRSPKTQFSEAFGGKYSFELGYYIKITKKILLKC